MPVGSPMSLPIREQDVETTAGDVSAPIYTEDAAAVLVWNNYQRAKNYVENNAWLLEWQETDILYQSPIPNRHVRVESGRPPRVPRFLVAKFSTTLARAMKRALFSEQTPFMLRPGSRTTAESIDAWTYLISVLLKRMKFKYHSGLQINCQTLQGTGIGKFGWEERERIVKTRRRKKAPEKVTLPTGPREVPTTESDEFEPKETKVTESWPFYEYRRLGTTLFDPKWSTPDDPEESAGYCIDIDYVDFHDLQRMRELSCYQKSKNNPGIPPEEDLRRYFFEKQTGSAPTGSQIEDSMTAQGSMVAHAEGRNRQTDIDPLKQPLLLIEQWDDRSVKTILHYDGRNLTIRNEDHGCESMCHTAATWWPIDNCGYGMGIGRITGADQRINQGVLNEALKMIAYPMNAPILVARGENAPTQNVISRHGGFWQVDASQSGGDVNKAVGFMKAPDVPADAWKFIDLSQRGGEEMSGADAQMQQGIPSGKQGATRSSFGAQRVAAQSDQNVADPVDSFSDGVIVPVVKFLIHMVKTKMPIAEIRKILSDKYTAEILKTIDLDQLLDSEFEVAVLAGQKLAARAAIMQLLPFFLQIVQQPQLLQYLHERGETVDFKVILSLLLQVSDLQQQPDIFRALTPRERIMLKQMNQAAQKVQGAIAVENVKGQNKQREIHAKGEVDLANKGAELAMQKISEGIPLQRATGLAERSADVRALREGLPGTGELS
jgi:hypothetical protein